MHLRYRYGDLPVKYLPNGHIDPKAIANRGGCTVAYQRSTDGRMFCYALAICNLKDNFNRGVGRAIASGYLNADRCYSIECSPSDPDSRFLASTVLNTVMDKVSRKHVDVDVRKALY